MTSQCPLLSKAAIQPDRPNGRFAPIAVIRRAKNENGGTMAAVSYRYKCLRLGRLLLTATQRDRTCEACAEERECDGLRDRGYRGRG